MKKIFRGYYPLADDELRDLWGSATFVFDTNVLLNLYRYQESTRDALLSVIEKVADRVWIPYHVALEFQRNRLGVIGEQQKRFTEVARIVYKILANTKSELDQLQLEKRHSQIDPGKFITELERTTKEFSEELTKLARTSTTVNSSDEIRNKLDYLLAERVGSPPESQSALNEIMSAAESRYKSKIPPGFEDLGKGNDIESEFTYGDLTYKSKYGDFIIWEQIITYAAHADVKGIIFITDDGKPDWWWQVRSNGPKTIGPRPELIEEIVRRSKVDSYHMYNPEGFLIQANKLLGAEVTEEAIDEVKEITRKERTRSGVTSTEVGGSASSEYASTALEGNTGFDYSNNNGRYTFGVDDFTFTTKWSTAGDDAIHAYSDDSSISWIALAPRKRIESIGSPYDYDHTSRARLAQVGDSVIWRNANGKFLATEVIDVKSRGRKWDGYFVALKYKIISVDDATSA